MADAKELAIKFRIENTQLKAELAKMREGFKSMGEHGVSSMQATSAAIRVAEGNFSRMLRPAELFLSKIPMIGQAMQAAFPVIGAIALLSVFSHVIEKIDEINEAFKKAAEAPKAFANAMGEVHSSLDTEHLKLVKTTDDLRNKLALLQGKPVNLIRVAIDDIALSTVSMSEQFSKSFAKIQTEAINTGLVLSGMMRYWKRLVDGESSGQWANDQLKSDQESIANLQQRNEEKISNAPDAQARLAAAKAAANEEFTYRASLIARYKAQVADLSKDIVTKPRQSDNMIAPEAEVSKGTSVNARGIQQLNEAIRLLTQQQVNSKIAMDNVSTTMQIAGLEQKNANSATVAGTTPFQKALESLKNSIIVATPELGRFAKAASEGQAEINRINSENKAQGLGKLTSEQEAQIQGLERQKAQNEAIHAINESMIKVQEQDAKKLAESSKKYAESIEKMGEEANKLAEHFETQAEEALKKSGEAFLKIADMTQGALDKLDNRSPLQKLKDEKYSALGKAQSEIDVMSQSGADPSAIADATQMKGKLGSAYDQQIKNLTDPIAGAKNGLKDIGSTLTSVGQQMQSVIGGAFTKLEDNLVSLALTGKAHWADLFKSIADGLMKIAMNQMFQMLFNSMAGSGNGLLSSIGGVFGGGHADGGDVNPGSVYRVGEQGTELFAPGVSGSIIPNHALGGGNTHIFSPTIHVGNNKNAEEVKMEINKALQKAAPMFIAQASKAQQESRMRSVRGRG
jgi:lambda family phage tail tape measure protein